MQAKLSLLSLLLLATSCSPFTVTANSLELGPNDSVTLSGVTFEYDKWSKRGDAEWLAKMKNSEDKWRNLFTTGFNNAAASAGIDKGSGAAVPVAVSITELNPGSQAARYFAGGFGAGKGVVTSISKAGDKGSVQVEGELSGGAFGGSFDKIIRGLGKAIATAIAESRGK